MTFTEGLLVGLVALVILLSIPSVTLWLRDRHDRRTRP